MRVRPLTRLLIARALALGLLLAVTAIALRTSRSQFGLIRPTGHILAFGNGCLQVGRDAERYAWVDVGPAGLFSGPAWRTEWSLAWRPFRAGDATGIPGGTGWYVVVPLWPLMPVFAALAAWAHAKLPAARVLEGGCRRCGYELADIPVSEGVRRCPECGTPNTDRAPPPTA